MASQFVKLPLISGSGGVTSLNALTGALVLSAGSNITLTPSGNTITISASGTGLGGITSINTDTTAAQLIVASATGTDFSISTAIGTTTIAIPSASATARGLITTGAQTIAGNKTFSGTIGASNFSGTSSGTNTGDQTITLTGAVTGSGTGSFSTTLATAANNTIKSNVSGGTASPIDNTFASLAAATVTISSNANAKGVANTFALSDHTHQLTAGASALDGVPQYDGSNWQSIFPEALFSPSRVTTFFDDFLAPGDLSAGSGIIGSLNWTPSFNGTGTTITWAAATANNHPGVETLSTGTTATGLSSFGLGANVNVSGSFLLGGGQLIFEGEVAFPTLGVTAQQYVATIGLIDSLSNGVAIASGVYFTYSNGAGADFFNINTTAVSTTTKTTTTQAVVAGTFYRLTLIVNAAASSVNFLINGTSVGTITTNIPTTASIRPAFMIIKSAGTTARTMQIDYAMLQQRFTTPR